MTRKKGRCGFESYSDKPRKRRKMPYSDKPGFNDNWADDSFFENERDYSPEQKLWVALLCDSIQEALSVIKICIDRHAYSAAARSKFESYKWIMSDRKSTGSIIWILEQLDYGHMLTKIQEFVRVRYQAQSVEPPAHIRSLYARRRTKIVATQESEQHSTSHSPSHSQSPERDDPDYKCHPGALPLPAAEAMQSLVTTYALGGIYTDVDTLEIEEPVTLH